MDVGNTISLHCACIVRKMVTYKKHIFDGMCINAQNKSGVSFVCPKSYVLISLSSVCRKSFFLTQNI